MFTDLSAHPDLTQQQHRALPGLSNTDLSMLKTRLLGQLRNPNPAALAYGTAFHAATLEPATYQRTDERGIRWTELEQLARQVRRQRYCRDLLYRGTPELTHTAVHLETGLSVKVRPDLLVRSPAGRRLTLLDFKTTSCRDEAQFLATIEQYDYDRQAAFYLDVLQADRFLIVGVQKKAPHAIWVFDLATAPLLLEQGRRKYRRLLRAHAAQLPARQAA